MYTIPLLTRLYHFDFYEPQYLSNCPVNSSHLQIINYPPTKRHEDRINGLKIFSDKHNQKNTDSSKMIWRIRFARSKNKFFLEQKSLEIYSKQFEFHFFSFIKFNDSLSLSLNLSLLSAK